MPDFLTIKNLLYFNALLLFMLFVLLSYLIIKKEMFKRVQERKSVLTRKLEPILYEYLIQGEPLKTRLIQKDDRSLEVVIHILEQYGEVLSGDVVQERVCTLANDILYDYLFKQLNNRRWSIRMNTLYHIEDFKMSVFANIVWNKFENRTAENDTELYQMIRVLATIEYPVFLNYLKTAAKCWPRFVYKDILIRLTSESFEVFVDTFNDLNDPFKQAIIEMIGEKRSFQHVSLIEDLLSDSQLEIRLSALKVLNNFGFISNVEKLGEFGRSNYFTERMMFAKVCGTLKVEEFNDLLLTLLKDKDWFVRNAAGEAISKLQNGLELLKRVIETEEDSFARDMAQQWIGKGGVK